MTGVSVSRTASREAEYLVSVQATCLEILRGFSGASANPSFPPGSERPDHTGFNLHQAALARACWVGGRILARHQAGAHACVEASLSVDGEFKGSLSSLPASHLGDHIAAVD